MSRRLLIVPYVTCADMAEKLEGPSFKVHDFSTRIVNQDVYFRVIKMKDSLLLWIGDRASMTDLAVAMPTRFVSHVEINPL